MKQLTSTCISSFGTTLTKFENLFPSVSLVAVVENPTCGILFSLGTELKMGAITSASELNSGPITPRVEIACCDR
jgi:hypothetical protein